MGCKKHGQSNPTFCKYCDAEQVEVEEQRMEMEREVRRQIEEHEMERYFRDHPHG
jgi:hypothetical protein